MNRLRMYLPNPAPDLDGACSMLFEMGGLVVIHDAAGCIENYTVYEEPRWFGADSLVLSSGLTHMDAVLGDEEKLISQLCETAEDLKPNFVAIVGSPVPFTLGMDLEGMAYEVQQRIGLPAFAVPCGSFDIYDAGAAEALQRLIKCAALKDTIKKPKHINLLGALPMDFSSAQITAIVSMFKELGITAHPFCMGTHFDDLFSMAGAELNIAISYSGLKAARFLKKEYGMPWVYGFPCNKNQVECLIKGHSICGPNKPCVSMQENVRCLVLGEQIMSSSLAKALCEKYGWEAYAGVTMSFEKSIADKNTFHLEDEEAIIETLSKKWDIVVGDPLYRLLPNAKYKKWFELPHAALSSHIYKAKELKEGLNDLSGAVYRFYEKK